MKYEIPRSSSEEQLKSYVWLGEKTLKSQRERKVQEKG